LALPYAQQLQPPQAFQLLLALLLPQAFQLLLGLRVGALVLGVLLARGADDERWQGDVEELDAGGGQSLVLLHQCVEHLVGQSRAACVVLQTDASFGEGGVAQQGVALAQLQ
jgi:hypothetical protein